MVVLPLAGMEAEEATGWVIDCWPHSEQFLRNDNKQQGIMDYKAKTTVGEKQGEGRFYCRKGTSRANCVSGYVLSPVSLQKSLNSSKLKHVWLVSVSHS